MNSYEFLLCVLLFGVFIFFELLNYRRIERLLNRLMAKSYQEFRYYEDKWPQDLDALEKVRKSELKEEEKEPKTSDKVTVDQFEEDWGDEEEAVGVKK